MRKVALLLIFVFTLSNFMVVGTQAAIPKPSVPEFTVELFDSSYDIQPTTTTNPFTGQITTNLGSHLEARTVEVRIKNEPFTPFPVTEGSSNWTAYSMYNIRWKGHYEQNWHEIYSPSNGFLVRDEGSETVYTNQGEYSSLDGLKMASQGMYLTFPPEAQIDFQVEAMVGYTHRVVEGGMAPWYFFGETSGWSSTQTLIITETAPTLSPSASPSPLTTNSGNPIIVPTDPISTPTDSQTSVLFGLDWVTTIIVVLLSIIVVLLVLVFLRRRQP